MSQALYLGHPSSLEHDPGPHPESAARITAIEAELDTRGWPQLERSCSSAASRAQLQAVHTPAHIDAIERLSARGGGSIDADTATNAGSFRAALHAAGGALELAELLLAGDHERGISIHRPPGHHAEAGAAMGFCLFNNVAVAARAVLHRGAAERLLVLDWDIHHGNGTNDIFHATAEVLYVSIHGWPLYPGTGPFEDRGAGPGEGYTINLPVPPASGDDVYASLVEHVVVPVALAYRPSLILVSAGFDAHRADPLGGGAVSEAGFAAMTRSLHRLAAELGIGLGLVLEGGYDLCALSSSVAVVLEELVKPPPLSSWEVPPHPLARAVRARLSERWSVLAGPL
jgi:acetoin utilization deacetylase AcuC-like enzyme